MMKQTTVLKAMNMMDEKRLEKFLACDCRDIGEIIEAVCDEEERGYVAFMSELYAICDKLEKEEKFKLDGLVKVNTEPPILTIKDSKSLFDNMPMPSFPTPYMLDNILKPMDCSNFIKRRD